ncbi:NADPH-dependent 7-cyano-7-deazaguanine reductase (plasmid) [Candidatus Photodesmus katoptron]|uniref:NADPH-dependent 7-cyano-7-deazaguanine reductase n=2 Tax=Candidatus Photodesmus anomalopis TaxID=28176 RepID=S3EG85_9GAMM|nr:NADPH-dependent 7-cyano-7-deazaguanine reductase [Candidatus Photodesmus katoptron Akat1]KEY90055.1 NADPH-dependent 7-cyano-7-deazaguanine reductase [Candidatus Photodesmus katoptron]
MFKGFDIWTAFELSWLNKKGKPEVAIAEFIIPQSSPNLIESKSFKLYLNSFNQIKFNSKEMLLNVLQNDLTKTSGSPVKIRFIPVDQPKKLNVVPDFFCIDILDIHISQYNYEEGYLKGSISNEIVTEFLCSHLLKSNCLVTNQPDWGSVYIIYSGFQINHEILLKYLISFRNHKAFHEQCVETIFSDIKYHCQTEKLTVFARYTRRGGLDINPFRSDSDNQVFIGRMPRQ